MVHPLMNGILIDEFSGGDVPIYETYRASVEKLYEAPTVKGRPIWAYGAGPLAEPGRAQEFTKALFNNGGYACLERYLTEPPTRTQAETLIEQAIGHRMDLWEREFPEYMHRVGMVLGYSCEPEISLNVDPTVDYRVFQDMQVRFLATYPRLFGLGGIQEYHSGYCDEENVRLAGRLFRHYAIEGNTAPYLDDPYELTHISNPDFADGLEGWAISEAEEDSIEPRSYKGHKDLQGRWPGTTIGDTFLWSQRSSEAPNTFRQQIMNLEPGRLYSLKMITGDYQDLISEVSEEKLHAVSVSIDGAHVIDGPKTSFQTTFHNSYSVRLGKFGKGHWYWMNYHWHVFRAEGTTAQLTVTDWASPEAAGGPVGQELMFNFIEVQPYIGF
jgi:hypothetical protein